MFGSGDGVEKVLLYQLIIQGWLGKLVETIYLYV